MAPVMDLGCRGARVMLSATARAPCNGPRFVRDSVPLVTAHRTPHTRDHQSGSSAVSVRHAVERTADRWRARAGGPRTAVSASLLWPSGPRLDCRPVNARSLDVIHALLAAHRGADWDGVRRLLHPEARIGVFSTGGRPANPEDALEAMRQAHAQTTYTAYVNEIEELDGNGFLLLGRVRYPHESGGFADVERVWVYVLRDDLLYRSAMFPSALEARQAYAVNPGLEAHPPER